LAGLKFLMLQSTYFCEGGNKGCSISTGARCSISAIVFWFVASLMTCAHAKERKNAAKDDKGDNREERQDDRGGGDTEGDAKDTEGDAKEDDAA
jgi:hypothetical protein